MTIDKILAYVLYTPENTNAVILRQMLNQFADDMRKEGATLQTKIITPTESAQQILPDVGYDGFSEVQVEAIDSEYIGSDVPRRGSSDLTISSGYVTYKSGYYSSPGGATIPTIGTVEPVATKGTVSNNQVRVKPSMTVVNGGYFPAGTVEGESVIVRASELVSGSQTITESGTYDVTNLAQVIVEIN